MPVFLIEGKISINNSSLNLLATGFVLLDNNWYKPLSLINIAFG
jgi:hypothetical protein